MTCLYLRFLISGRNRGRPLRLGDVHSVHTGPINKTRFTIETEPSAGTAFEACDATVHHVVRDHFGLPLSLYLYVILPLLLYFSHFLVPFLSLKSFFVSFYLHFCLSVWLHVLLPACRPVYLAAYVVA